MTLIAKIKKAGFKSKFFTDTPYVYSSKEPVRRTLWLEEIAMWFRNEHNLLVSVYSNASGYLWNRMDAAGGTSRGWSEDEGPNDSGCWDTYDDALEAGLTSAIKFIEIRIDKTDETKTN